MDRPTPLLALLSRCLETHTSLDILVRHEKEQSLPDKACDMPGSVSEVMHLARKRFMTVLEDVCNYGTRKDYSFTLTNRTEAEKHELDWLQGNFSQLPRQTAGSLRTDATEPKPFEPNVRRRSMGECVACAVQGMQTGDVPLWVLNWLSRDMGYNLDWIFFGVGSLLAEWDDEGRHNHVVPAPGTKYDEETDTVVYEDMTALHERHEMSLWGFTDWQWLFNLRALVKSVYKAPTIPLLSRVVSGWRIPTQLPQMPNILAWIDWLVVWLVREFVEGKPAPGWKQDVIEMAITHRNSTLILLGLSGQSATQYRTSKAEPTTCVLRLAWILRLVIERRGRDGFLDYLDLVDDEARVRGYGDLYTVFQQRGWSRSVALLHKRKTEKAAQAAAAREQAEREKNGGESRPAPMGVPLEAKLSPLELLRHIQEGKIAIDSEADMPEAWQTPEQPARRSRRSRK